MLILNRWFLLSIILFTIANRTHCNKTNVPKYSPYPIVLWHGIGDFYCNSFMNTVKEFLETTIKGVKVISLKIGTNIIDDFKNDYFMNINEQINIACNVVSSSGILKNGYNAIGFSQGAQFFRGVVQRCPKPPIINFISVGGQHQGIYGIPHCSSKSSKFCDLIRQFISHIAYYEQIQKHVVQAQYWHDPLHEDVYKKRSSYLSEINNELVLNETYKSNLLKLKNFVLIKFFNDTIVDPVESEWFGFYKPNQSVDTYKLQQSILYIEDRLGLKQLNDGNRLHFLTSPGDHMKIDWDWFLKNVVHPFLI